MAPGDNVEPQPQPNMFAQFGEQQQQMLQAVMLALQATQQQTPRQARTPDGEEFDIRDNRMRDSEVGYFQPDLPDSYCADDPVTVGSESYYRDVYTFIDRIKDVAAYRGEDKVKQRLPALLRGSAQLWYTSSLDQLSKNGLRHTPGLETWYDTLTEHFRRPMSESLSQLTRMRYSLQDAASRRPFMRYVADVQRHARNAGFSETVQQLLYAYNGVDVVLKKTLSEPTRATTAAAFIRDADAQKEDWAEMARLWSRGSRQGATAFTTAPTTRASQGSYTRGGRGGYRRAYTTPSTQQSEYIYQRTDRQPQRRDQAAYDAKPKRQNYEPRRGQGDKTKSTSGGKPYSGPTNKDSNPLKPFTQKPVKGHNADFVDDGNDGSEHDALEDAYHGDEEGEDGDWDEDAHSGEEEVTMYFGKEEAPQSLWRCTLCHSSFASNNKLHQHLKQPGNCATG